MTLPVRVTRSAPVDRARIVEHLYSAGVGDPADHRGGTLPAIQLWTRSGIASANTPVAELLIGELHDRLPPCDYLGELRRSSSRSPRFPSSREPDDIILYNGSHRRPRRYLADAVGRGSEGTMRFTHVSRTVRYAVRAA